MLRLEKEKADQEHSDAQERDQARVQKLSLELAELQKETIYTELQKANLESQLQVVQMDLTQVRQMLQGTNERTAEVGEQLKQDEVVFAETMKNLEAASESLTEEAKGLQEECEKQAVRAEKHAALMQIAHKAMSDEKEELQEKLEKITKEQLPDLKKQREA